MAREYDYDREQYYEEVYDEDYDSEEDGAEEELSLIDRILIGIGVKKPTSSADKTNEDERSPIKEDERERNPFGGSRNLNEGIELDEKQSQNRARGNEGNIGVVGRKGCDNIELMQPRAFDDKEMLKAVTSVREQGHVIILNLELCDATTQMNFYTYAMGLCAGVKGKMAQVSESILIIAPQSITLTGYPDSAAGQVDPLMAAVSG